LEKFQERASQWGSLGVGLLMTLKAFRVYVESVLLFVGQLEDLPKILKTCESAACRQLFPGPKDWMTADGFRELKTLYASDELRDIESIVVASKARVAQFEANGALDVQGRAEKMESLDCAATSCSLARSAGETVVSFSNCAAPTTTCRQFSFASLHMIVGFPEVLEVVMGKKINNMRVWLVEDECLVDQRLQLAFKEYIPAVTELLISAPAQPLASKVKSGKRSGPFV
jgi:hypothetical protein